MNPSFVSTQEVAAMINVTVSTVKRWADGAVLPCVKTQGGHRKFLLKDIIRFAGERGFALSGTKPPVMTADQENRLRNGVASGDKDLIAGVFREEALQADREGILTLLLYLYKHNMTFPRIMDDVVGPAFKTIGLLWEEGEISVDQEHAASQATLEAIVQMSTDLHRKNLNGMTALCACPGMELHELGLRGMAYALQCEGWKVQLLGSNTPVESIGRTITKSRPELVCLSFSSSRMPATVRQGVDKISRSVHTYRGCIIAGGLRPEKHEKLAIDHFASSIEDGIAFTREIFHLKPGPHSGTSAKRQRRS